MPLDASIAHQPDAGFFTCIHRVQAAKCAVCAPETAGFSALKLRFQVDNVEAQSLPRRELQRQALNRRRSQLSMPLVLKGTHGNQCDLGRSVAYSRCHSKELSILGLSCFQAKSRLVQLCNQSVHVIFLRQLYNARRDCARLGQSAQDDVRRKRINRSVGVSDAFLDFPLARINP